MKSHLTFEKAKWNRVFKSELASHKISFKLFPCSFWEQYYQEIIKYISRLLSYKKNHPIKILELGCGSGKGSLLLSKDIHLTLVDFSEEALNLARFFSQKLKRGKKVKYINADIFDVPLHDNSYDLVWNAGTIEHYKEREIIALIKKMVRLTKIGGHILIGLPNPKSLAFKKADLLGSTFGRKWLKFIPGYRNDSEKAYAPVDLLNICKSISNYKLKNISIVYVGSYLFVSAPKFIIKVSKYFDFIFKKNKFMYLISIKKE